MATSSGKLAIGILTAGLAAWPVVAEEAGSSPLDRMAQRLAEVRDELIEVRRDLHRHPELSGQEERTAGVVAARLEKLGLEVTTGVGGHGVVAVLRGGKPGGVAGYRADMDAVPAMIPDPVAEIASRNPGVRHICGHDVHTTVGLGVAEALAAVRDELPGTVKLIFQPAEETAAGARAMVADGALAEPTPEAIFAVHTGPLPVGQVGAVEGLTLVGRDMVSVRPRAGADRAAVEAAVREALTAAATVPTPTSFFELAMMPLPEGEFALAGVVRATDQEILGQVMPSSDATRRRARQVIEERLAAAAEAGLAFDLDYSEKTVAGVWSDPELVKSSYDAIRGALGEDGLIVTGGGPPAFSEDFGSLLEEIPGAMYWLGVANAEKGYNGMPHHPAYAADEGAIEAGARAMAAVVWDFLARR